ncbi:3-hydroxyisobutyrate dehydrogenase [Chelonia mydas]|uniref:3-hydroxyisobutyrate dehydrogenase n=1 Tax=Chelonia mydas TaxID=8469 RepID=M7BWH3_CHEMY|nr:3-hydroxyisobutyrate dehydrogenase [Chelonia mydas]
MMESQNRKRAPAWTEREVRDLIAVWGEESVLSELRSSFRNAKTFVKISKGMKDRGHNRDPKQCRVKLKELRQAYQKTREANGRSRCISPKYSFIVLKSVCSRAMASKTPVGFIGLGNMGNPMAKNLVKHGYPVVAYDVFPEAGKEFQDSGAQESPGIRPYLFEDTEAKPGDFRPLKVQQCSGAKAGSLSALVLGSPCGCWGAGTVETCRPLLGVTWSQGRQGTFLSPAAQPPGSRLK